MTDAKLLEGFEERLETVKGTRLRCFVGGPPEGRPVVLVHGLGGSAGNWTFLGPLLARQRRVLVVELPGHGGSEPLPAAPSLAPYADRVVRAAERLGFAPAAYVGHSLGGLVVLRAAAREPDAVTALVLAAGAGINSSTRAAARALAFAGWLRPGRRISPYWRVVAGRPLLKRLVFGRWMASDPRALPARAVEASLRYINLHTDTDSAWRALTRDDPRSDLHLVRCPAVVLWGADDNQLPVQDGVDYARRLRAPLRVVAGAGHLLVLERPDACMDAIDGFLRRVEG